MNSAFLSYFRCPSSLAQFMPTEPLSDEQRLGFFKFGEEVTCYGKASSPVSKYADDLLVDCIEQAYSENGTCYLPFNPTEVTLNLQRERYIQFRQQTSLKAFVFQSYYILRPLLPVAIRRHLQKFWLKGRAKKIFPHWPIDRSIDKMFENLMSLAVKASPEGVVPFVWFWPEGKSSCAIMTHDIETALGLAFSDTLMDINDSFEIKSSFQLIPNARYEVCQQTLSTFKDRGFETNVHDLKHDGHLFDSEDSFKRAAERINKFMAEFESHGFRAGALYRNQEWLKHLKIAYDMSVPNVGHLDPQPGGCCTLMPYFIDKILEIPVTMTQDYSLFNVIGTYSFELWLEQINLVLEHHGIMSFIVHPDYLKPAKAKKVYSTLVTKLVELRKTSCLWITLPGEVNSWWRQRDKMRVVFREHRWVIEGDGSERAKIAYARIRDGRIMFSFT